MNILVVGATEFIGNALALRLIMRGENIVGIDDIKDDEELRLKLERLKRLGITFDYADDIPYDKPLNSSTFTNFTFIRTDLTKERTMKKIFDRHKFHKVANMANGFDYPTENKCMYAKNDFVSFINIAENCQRCNVRHIVYASSEAVYGETSVMPTSENCRSDNPCDIFSSTKKANELTAYTYSKKYGISTIGLRYFTIYGAFSAPRTLPMKIANAIDNGLSSELPNDLSFIDLLNIDDAAEATILALSNVIFGENDFAKTPAEIYNVGCGAQIQTADFIAEIEKAIEKDIAKETIDDKKIMQSFADTSKIKADLKFSPSISLEDGVKSFIKWYISEKNPLRKK